MVKNLKTLREEHGLSQQKLAEQLGLTQQAIYKYERTSVEPDIDTLIAMAELLHTTVDHLIGNDTDSDTGINLTSAEAECIRHIRRQPPDVRENIFRLAESMDSYRNS